MDSNKDPSLSNFYENRNSLGSHISLYEAELKHYIYKFIQYLLVRTDLGSQDLLDFDLKLQPVDRDECYHLPEEVKTFMNTCNSVCGWFNREERSIVIYLGCLGRRLRLVEFNIENKLEYTLFHLMAHLLQLHDHGLTKHAYKLEVSRDNQDIRNDITYSLEVEADYLARIFSFLSNEEDLWKFDGNRSKLSLWAPLQRAMLRLKFVCDEALKNIRSFGPDLYDTEAICSNPFRWIAAKTERIVWKLRGVIYAFVSNASYKVKLINPLAIRIKEQFSGLYLSEKELCFSTIGDKLHVCYSPISFSRLDIHGFKVEFEKPLEIDLALLRELVINLNAPEARVRIEFDDEKKEISATLKYTGDIPKPAILVHSNDEFNELISLIDSKIGLPNGMCDNKGSLYIVPLPMYDLSRISNELPRGVLYLSNLIIPVDKNICLGLE